MNPGDWRLAAGFGAGLGALHLLVFSRGVGALMDREGSGPSRRRSAILAGGRFLMTFLMGYAAVRLWGLSPIGLGGGLVLSVFMARIALGVLTPRDRISKENST